MLEKIVNRESTTIRIEVETNPHTLLLVFDRKQEMAAFPYQDVFDLAELMEKVHTDVKLIWPTLLLPTTSYREQAQVKVNHKDGLVFIFTSWTDRLRFTCLDAWVMVGNALRLQAQDAYLEERNGVFFRYHGGMIKEVHNTRIGTVQKVR